MFSSVRVRGPAVIHGADPHALFPKEKINSGTVHWFLPHPRPNLRHSQSRRLFVNNKFLSSCR